LIPTATRKQTITLKQTIVILWVSLTGLPVAANDVTNDAVVDASKYASLQAAADAIPATGGILRIPPGTYEITQPLRIKTGDTTIEGVGTATHIVNQNTNGQPAILIESPEVPAEISGTGAASKKERLWRVRLTGLRITGNKNSGAGIEARRVEEIFVQGVTISHNGGDGLRLIVCYEDPRISDCLFTYNKQCGVYLEGCHDIIVSANHFEENMTGLKCTDGFNLTMSGNNLDDHLGDGIVIENTYGSVVAGNMIEECQGWAIVLDRDCYGITMSANVIAHDFSGGIDLRDAHGCAISANTFTLVKKIGLAIREKSGSITVSGNNFSDSWIGQDANGREIDKRSVPQNWNKEKDPNEAAGILLEGCQAVVISGNLFSRLSTDAIIQTDNCREVLTSANVTHTAK